MQFDVVGLKRGVRVIHFHLPKIELLLFLKLFCPFIKLINNTTYKRTVMVCKQLLLSLFDISSCEKWPHIFFAPQIMEIVAPIAGLVADCDFDGGVVSCLLLKLAHEFTFFVFMVFSSEPNLLQKAGLALKTKGCLRNTTNRIHSFVFRD